MNGRIFIALVALCLAACAASPSDGYERHGLSRLVEVPGSATEYVFEVGDPPQGAGQTEEDAEAVRMRWLSEWLAVQGLCQWGHQIVDRRPFGPFEYNPMHAKLRYLVRCRSAPEEVAKEN